MDAGSVLAFWTVALLLIVVPGADWAFTIGAGLRRAVLPAVGGLVMGYAIITAVVAAGVGALVAESPTFLTGLTLVGGLYLVWHGASTFARPGEISGGETDGSGWRTFARGVGVSGLNPKGLLIFLALLPQFTDPGYAWPVAWQIGVLGCAFMATCGVFYLGLGTFTRSALVGRPGSAKLISRLSGIAMVGIGAWLIVDRLL
ncbi:LysE family translocator [Actinomadura barringtoniae]|uniref:LysE family translocator n=1 Tax=Actinomadura barringtoniae TaxID=1427535 RepID=A0A939PFQ2_9ACTN|nr:LysE family translocator [Actinomadura barringtoniae]MBO2451685.1 LysE family translocator [Actinomadura barringtoniae]